MGGKIRKLLHGSMTVEASVIVPCAFMVVALLVVYQFYCVNVNWYTSAAAEVAILGNSRSTAGGWDDSQEAEATARASERVSDAVVPGTAPKASVSCGKSGSVVSYEGQKLPLSAGGKFFRWSVRADVRKVHPVKILLDTWALRYGKEKG